MLNEDPFCGPMKPIAEWSILMRSNVPPRNGRTDNDAELRHELHQFALDWLSRGMKASEIRESLEAKAYSEELAHEVVKKALDDFDPARDLKGIAPPAQSNPARSFVIGILLLIGSAALTCMFGGPGPFGILGSLVFLGADLLGVALVLLSIVQFIWKLISRRT